MVIIVRKMKKVLRILLSNRSSERVEISLSHLTSVFSSMSCSVIKVTKSIWCHVLFICHWKFPMERAALLWSMPLNQIHFARLESRILHLLIQVFKNLIILVQICGIGVLRSTTSQHWTTHFALWNDRHGICGSKFIITLRLVESRRSKAIISRSCLCSEGTRSIERSQKTPCFFSQTHRWPHWLPFSPKIATLHLYHPWKYSLLLSLRWHSFHKRPRFCRIFS